MQAQRINVSKLMQVWNPFKLTIWVKIKKPLTRQEIELALESKRLTPPNQTSTYLNFWDESPRHLHVSRIAWFVENLDLQYPIDIDFGIPGMCDFEMCDGNHRFAAAIYRREPFVLANCSGSIETIEQFLHHDERILDRR